MATQIQGIQGLSVDELRREIERGGRFVIFQYVISVVVLCFRRSSDIYFVRGNESATAKGLPWTLLTGVLGWWGIPWGLIWTPMTIYRNLSGGRDVTGEVAQQLGLYGAGGPGGAATPPPLPPG